MTEIRKIRTYGSSLVITLPKKWDINGGDWYYVSKEGDTIKLEKIKEQK